MKTKDDVFSHLLDALQRTMPATVVKTWFDDVSICSVSNNTLTLQVSTKFKRDVILERYSSQIKEAMSELFGEPYALEVKLSEDKPSGAVKKARTDYLDFSFDNFIEGDSNIFAAAAARAVADAPGRAYNPLFIYGGSGLGKTHLLFAIMNHVKAEHPDFVIRMFSAEIFTNDFVLSLQNKNTHLFQEKYRNCDMILVDDVQFFGSKDKVQEEFFHTFNALYESGNQVVLTSDRPPRSITTLFDRLQSRFESGPIYDIQAPDFETRMAIIKSKGLRLGMIFPDDVVLYLATVITSNVRQLEGIIKKMAAWRDLMGGPLDVPAAEKAVQEYQQLSPGLNPTPEMIIAEVSLFYGIDEKDILGKGRQANVVKARQVAMYLIRQITNNSLKEIGTKIFRKDHTTVIYSIETVEKNRASDQTLNGEVELILENIRER